MSTSKTKGVSLRPPHWSYYSTSSQPTANDPEVLAHQDLYAWIENQMHEGKPVYVRFHDPRRQGAIGKLKTFEAAQQTPINPSMHSYHYYRDRYPKYPTYHAHGISVEWDGRKNLVHPYMDEIEILRDYTGPTVWAWTQKAPETRVIPTIKGHLGEEIVVDDFVSFVSRKYGNVKLHFGNVSRINHNGSVWVNTLKLRDGDRPAEAKVHDVDTIVKIGKDLIDRLMMARLAAR